MNATGLRKVCPKCRRQGVVTRELDTFRIDWSERVMRVGESSEFEQRRETGRWTEYKTRDTGLTLGDLLNPDLRCCVRRPG